MDGLAATVASHHRCAPAAAGRALAAVLLVLPLLGCRSFMGGAAPDRLEHGYALILPGILGKQGWDQNLAAGLDDADVPAQVEIHDWTKGPLLFGLNLADQGANRRQAEEIVAKIVEYQDRYPGRPVYLIGHSGGATMVVRVLEAMPPGRRIERAILLAAGLDSDYDLRAAMSHSRSGIVAFASPYDVPISMPLAGIHGALQGELSLSAATVGFAVPSGLPENERREYERLLDQRQYALEMWGSGHPGGHFGWTTPAFVARYLAPLLRPAPDPPPQSQVTPFQEQAGRDPYFRQATAIDMGRN
jgi:hypothetical protein